jgi:hypothetical protein
LEPYTNRSTSISSDSFDPGLILDVIFSYISKAGTPSKKRKREDPPETPETPVNYAFSPAV